MPPGMIGSFAQIGASSEILYSFVIIIFSLMIYLGTKEIYNLSSDKGIGYFRDAFLFFSVAYFLRAIIKLALINFNLRPKNFEYFFLIQEISILLFMFFSSIAIFSLLQGVLVKKFKSLNTSIYSYLFAFLISFVVFFSKVKEVYFGINLFLLLIVLFVIFYSHNYSESKDNLFYIVYILLSFFWILNILDTLIPQFLQNLQLLIYTLSTLTFSFIAYKVLRKVG